MREQMLFLVLFCSACAEIGYAFPFCFSCKLGFSTTRLSPYLFLRKYETWKASTSASDKSPEAFRKSASYAKDKSSATAASTPSAPELWYARLVTDQSIITAALARVASV